MHFVCELAERACVDLSKDAYNRETEKEIAPPDLRKKTTFFYLAIIFLLLLRCRTSALGAADISDNAPMNFLLASGKADRILREAEHNHHTSKLTPVGRICL